MTARGRDLMCDRRPWVTGKRSDMVSSPEGCRPIVSNRHTHPSLPRVVQRSVPNIDTQAVRGVFWYALGFLLTTSHPSGTHDPGNSALVGRNLPATRISRLSDLYTTSIAWPDASSVRPRGVPATRVQTVSRTVVTCYDVGSEPGSVGECSLTARKPPRLIEH